MRVLLVNGPDLKGDSVMIRSGDRWPHRIPRKKVKEVYHSYPFWFAYSAAILKQRGHHVTYLDAIREGLDLEETVAFARENRPDLVALATSTPTIAADLELARQLKASFSPHVTMVDTHATVFHESLMNENPFVDSVVRGEFEVALAELADGLPGGTSQVSGLTHRADGIVTVNPDRKLFWELDDLPWPDRDVVDQRWYRSFLAKTDSCFMVMSSRGCPFRCTFCLWVPVMFKNKVRLRKVDKVLDEIIHLRDHYGAKEIFFHDDTVNITVKRMMELSEAFLRREANMEWIANMRADQSTPEMYKLMKRAGCHKVLLGVESGNQDLLDRVEKELDLEQVRQTVAYAREAGIVTHCTFLVGIPGESYGTLRKTRDFIKDIGCDDIQVSVMTPYPGTPFFETVKHMRKNWDDFDGSLGESFCDLTKDDLQNAVNRIYLEHYTSLDSIYRRLIRIRTWQDIKENLRKVKSFVGRISSTGMPRPLDRQQAT